LKHRMSIDLGDVQKTLLLPLWGRALESRKANPILVDDKAKEIVEAIDYDFESMGKDTHELTKAAWIIRCIWADAIIKDFIEMYPDASIVNIGCGLDTTFNRVDNKRITWYDLDLPDVIELRRKLIAPENRQHLLPFSLFDYDKWLKEIEKKNNVFLLSLGVLYYFAEDRIRGFFQKMAANYPGSEMFFDVSSPIGVKVANKLVIEKSGTDEKSFLKWGCKNPKTIASWDKRIKIIKAYPFFRRSEVHIENRLKARLSDFLKIQYLLHIQFGK
jgi:O-methyltransferase involved in polyketide biosynthesis